MRGKPICWLHAACCAWVQVCNLLAVEYSSGQVPLLALAVDITTLTIPLTSILTMHDFV